MTTIATKQSPTAAILQREYEKHYLKLAEFASIRSRDPNGVAPERLRPALINANYPPEQYDVAVEKLSRYAKLIETVNQGVPVSTLKVEQERHRAETQSLEALTEKEIFSRHRAAVKARKARDQEFSDAIEAAEANERALAESDADRRSDPLLKYLFIK